MRESDPRHAELRFRLGELLWQRSLFTGQQEQRQEATQQFEWLASSAPNHERLDEVLFLLAFVRRTEGRTKEAVEHTTQLIRQYPRSRLLADAYLELAEHYARQGDPQKAKKAAQKALDVSAKTKRPFIHCYAQYWLGYVAFVDGDLELARPALRAAVAEEKLLPRRDEGLRGAALRMLAATVEKVKDANVRAFLVEEVGDVAAERLLAR